MTIWIDDVDDEHEFDDDDRDDYEICTSWNIINALLRSPSIDYIFFFFFVLLFV